MVELRQLRTFQEVVKRGSFVRAAEELRYAQSTVTLHVQQLERDFGVKLFARNGRAALHLTEAGRMLTEQSETVLGRVEGLEQAMTSLSTGGFGHLRVGSIEPTASLRLPTILARYSKERPKVRLTVEVGGTETIAGKVVSGELDVGLCAPLHSYEGLSFEPLFVEKMALLVPEGDPLDEKDMVEMADLAERRLMLSARSCTYRKEIERVLAGIGANAPVDVEIGSVEIGSIGALKEAVRLGLGVAILPEASMIPPPSGTTLKSIRGVEPNLNVGLLLSSEEAPLSRALEEFVHTVRKALGTFLR
ncbi:MAG: LysR family transcriptional regulator [Rubrobacteraceae bacterium]